MTDSGPMQSQYAESRHCNIGSTLVEYVIIGTTTLLIVLAGLQVFSGNFAALFGLLKNDMQKQISMTHKAQIAPITSASNQEKPQTPTEAGKAIDTPVNGVSTVAPYHDIQVSGSNGIDIVDYYANIIKDVATKMKDSGQSDITFVLMLDDLSAEGHHVADDERSALTHFTKYGNSFDFNIQGRYAQTKNRAITYLDQNPHLLSTTDAQTLRTASNNITQQMVDFLGDSNPGAISAETVNQKFTDAGGGNGATYVDQQASKICDSGGQNCT